MLVAPIVVALVAIVALPAHVAAERPVCEVMETGYPGVKPRQ